MNRTKALKNSKGKISFNLISNKKVIFAVVFATALYLVLSSFSPIVHSEYASGFTPPFTEITYGNAWSGTLAFDVSGITQALVIIDTNGTVLNERDSTTSYGAAYFIAPDLILFQGEPQAGGARTSPEYATHIWNLTSDTTQDFPDVFGHHDIQYDPVTNTFLTLQEYVRQVGNNQVLFDKIVELDQNGTLLWSWDTYDHIPLSEADPFNLTTAIGNQTVEDFSHANSLDWDYNNGIIYLNLRNTNTFYKIDQTSGDIVWACGQFGNFTLLGTDGQQVSSLWYHSHDVKMVAPDVFTMFDNDFDNVTNPDDCHSTLTEVTLNENSMTASISFSWEAPKQYWTPYGGANLLLPNGDFIGNFGVPTHQDPSFNESLPWDFNNTGAVFVEVNPSGQVVRTFTFPVGWYVYRIEAMTSQINNSNSPNPTPTSTPAPTPSSSPNSILPPLSMSLQGSIVAIVVVAIIVAAVVLFMAVRRGKKRL